MFRKFTLCGAVAATAITAACQNTGSDDVHPETLRRSAVEQIALYNELGIDPLQADPHTLALMLALCGTAAAVSENSGAVVADAGTIRAFCAVAAKAAAPAR